MLSDILYVTIKTLKMQVAIVYKIKKYVLNSECLNCKQNKNCIKIL